MKLGKLIPRHDSRMLQFAMYTSAVPPAPAHIDWTPAMQFPCGAMGNLKYGDCTCAGMGHAEQLWTANTSVEFTPPDNAIIAAYSAISGFDPVTGAHDNGAVELDVLKYWQNTGIAGKKILAYADVNPHLLQHVQQAIWLFGVGYIGISLPITAQQQIGGLWDVVGDGQSGDSAPGSWGGHCVDIVAYTPDEFLCITWGHLQRMSYHWFLTYCDEFHVPLSPDWINAKGTGASGFDLATLQSDLKLITA